MRRPIKLLFCPLLLAALMAGCGGSGLDVGMPSEVPSGAPPAPPGTSREMASLRKTRGAVPPRPPG